MKIKFLLLGTSLSFIPLTVNAQCVATQDCATLGYTETTCNGGKGVKCPFGNKWACLGANEEECMKIACEKLNFKYSCTGTGYTGGAGSACNGKYNYCTCASGYEWKNGACQQKAPDYSACQIGTLFYSDGTCSNEKEDDKELLGVVIYEKTASESGWVMTVEPIKKDIFWSEEIKDIPELKNITSESELTDIQKSCINTDIITTYGNAKIYPAAWAAKNYKKGGKKWCLPSAGLLKNITNTVNRSKINTGIAIAGGVFVGETYYTGSFWVGLALTSSEYDDGIIWVYSGNGDRSAIMSTYRKNDPQFSSVRPVFAF